MRSLFLFSCALLPLGSLNSVANAQKDPAENQKYPPNISGAQSETYRRIGSRELKIWIFSNSTPVVSTAPRPAIVFFFGGGWRGGSPLQFVPQAKALAQRGLVACVADYRVASRDGVKPADCVADAKACIRWVRSEAGRLGVDPERIVAGGGSAGGHLAAATAFLPGLDPDGEGKTVSCIPNALALFNPALVLAPLEGLKLDGFLSQATAERFGCLPEDISPAHHIRKGSVPTLIHHGKADSTVSFESAERFAKLMKQFGNRCDLFGYDDQPHGFFNRPDYQNLTLQKTDAFLVSLGYLPQPSAP